MKKLLITLALLAMAAPAFAAAGADLSSNYICPGDVGALSDGGPMNCAAVKAAGKLVQVLATFNPAEAIADLAGIDGLISLSVVGDLSTDATFWNANGCNNTIAFNAIKPAGGCASTSLAAAAAGAFTPNTSTSTIDFYYSLSNSTTNAVNAGDHIFAFALNFDPAKSVDGGGTCTGCSLPTAITLSLVTPASFNGDPTTNLTTGTGLYPGTGNQSCFNGGCAAVPTKAKTWGQLKSMYR